MIVFAAATVMTVAGLLILAIWLAFSWHRVSGLRVDRAYVEQRKLVDRGGRPTDHVIAVEFSTPDDLVKLRSAIGIGFITARMSSCIDRDADNEEVITQRAGYMSDRQRVTRLPPTRTAEGLRYRYRASFDDDLTRLDHDRLHVERALGVPGGLCLTLNGASRWAGKLWSDIVPISVGDQAR